MQHEATGRDLGPAKPRMYTVSPTKGCPVSERLNANLMRAPGLEPASDERRARQAFDPLDVRDGAVLPLPLAAPSRASRRRGRSRITCGASSSARRVRNREVTALHRVGASWLPRCSFRGERPRKHEEPRRRPVEALHDAERGAPADRVPARHDLAREGIQRELAWRLVTKERCSRPPACARPRGSRRRTRRARPRAREGERSPASARA